MIRKIANVVLVSLILIALAGCCPFGCYRGGYHGGHHGWHR